MQGFWEALEIFLEGRHRILGRSLESSCQYLGRFLGGSSRVLEESALQCVNKRNSAPCMAVNRPERCDSDLLCMFLVRLVRSEGYWTVTMMTYLSTSALIFSPDTTSAAMRRRSSCFNCIRSTQQWQSDLRTGHAPIHVTKEYHFCDSKRQRWRAKMENAI